MVGVRGERRRTALVVGVALAAGALGLGASLWWQRAVQPATPEPPAGVAVAAIGNRMPVLRLRDLDGRATRLPGRFAGRPLLLNFWASWCAPCREEMPDLQRFAARQGPDGVQVVGIALDDPEAVRAFLHATPVDYPLLLDTPGPSDASVILGDRRGLLPYSVLVAADGRVLKQQLGPFAPGRLADWARP